MVRADRLSRCPSLWAARPGGARMMNGSVNADLEALLRLHVQDAGGQDHEVETVIDTGFNGFLTLPPALLASLGLPWLYRQQGQLADGSIHVFDVYAATVIWDGQ